MSAPPPHRHQTKRRCGCTLWRRALLPPGQTRRPWPEHEPRSARGCPCRMIARASGSTTVPSTPCSWRLRRSTCPRFATSQYSRCCPATRSWSSTGNRRAPTAATSQCHGTAHMHPTWRASPSSRAGVPSTRARSSPHCPAPLNSFSAPRHRHPGDEGTWKKQNSIFFSQRQLDVREPRMWEIPEWTAVVAGCRPAWLYLLKHSHTAPPPPHDCVGQTRRGSISSLWRRRGCVRRGREWGPARERLFFGGPKKEQAGRQESFLVMCVWDVPWVGKSSTALFNSLLLTGHSAVNDCLEDEALPSHQHVKNKCSDRFLAGRVILLRSCCGCVWHLNLPMCPRSMFPLKRACYKNLLLLADSVIVFAVISCAERSR